MKIRILLFLASLCLGSVALHSAPAIPSGIGSGYETACLQTDRNLYIAGETLFFKLYVLNSSSHLLSTTSHIAYLVLRNRNNIPVAKIKLKLTDGMGNGTVFLPDSLSSGPYQLVAFTNWMRNTGEDSFFHKEILITNRFDKEILLPGSSPVSGKQELAAERIASETSWEILPGKQEYHKREKISLILKCPGNKPVDSARLSVSVFEEEPITGIDFSIKEFLETTPVKAVLPQIRAGELCRFLPEIKGEIIQGKVTDVETRQPVPSLCVFLTAADTLVNLQYAYSDSSGLFRFLLNGYYNGRDIYFSLKDAPGNRKFRIELEDKFELKKGFIPSKYSGNPELRAYLQKSQDIVTIQKNYAQASSVETEKPASPVCRGPELYDKASHVIFPADFEPLNDFSEITREILPPQFSLRKHNGRYTAGLADEGINEFMNQEAVIFLDGVFIGEMDPLMELGSSKVKRIDLVCKRYNCGELLFPGILAVFSKTNEIGKIQPDASRLRFQLGDYLAGSAFNSTGYGREIPDNQPDFRQLIYWNPDLAISRAQEAVPDFFASDHSGNYIIRIEGITSAGIPLNLETRISIK